MGLDAFKTGSSSSSTSNSTSNTSSTQSSSDGYYKTFGDDSGRKKVIKSEEEWDQILDFINEEFRMDEDDLMDASPEVRCDIIHKAMLEDTEAEAGDFYPKRQCIVCDQTFSFPTTWNFTKYEGEAVCKDHTIMEVQEAYEEMNELHG